MHPEHEPMKSESEHPVHQTGASTATLPGVDEVSAADNQWFGDMMVLQVLTDSDNVNEQEREVLTRWLEASDRPARRAAPSVAELERDAQRYRWLRDKSACLSYTSDSGPQPSTTESRMMYAIKSAGKRTLDMIEIRLLCHHLGPYDEPIWRDGEHFDYAANMDAAIDAAMKGETK